MADDSVKVIICDDDPAVVTTLKDYCAHLSTQLGIPLNIEIFRDGDELVNGYRGADILLLDVEMPLLDGIEASAIIREKDAGLCIVFVTSFERYAISGYRVGAYRYLVKPVDYDAFLEALDDIVRRCYQNKGAYLGLRLAQGYVRLRPMDIVYVETLRDHKLGITTSGGQRHEAHETIQQVYDQLSNFDFYQPHRCYLINFNHVLSWSMDQVQMDDGSSIPISKYRKADFSAAFTDFLAKTTLGSRRS